MKRVNIIQIVLLCGLSVVSSSCGKDFLTKTPPQTLSRNVLETRDGVEGMLIGAYAQLRGGDPSGGALVTNWSYGSVYSDEAYKGTDAGDRIMMNALERYEGISNNDQVSGRWAQCYLGVSRVNQAMEFLEAVVAAGEGDNWSTGRAKVIRGELKALRAWFHLQAQLVFRSPVYIKTPAEQDGVPIDQIANDGQTPIWDKIVAEIDEALPLLPDYIKGEPGRFNKTAALTMKAQVLMYQNKHTEAAPILQDIIDNGLNNTGGKLVLAGNYYDNYDEDTENNSESIFEVQAATSATNHTSMSHVRYIQPYTGADGGAGMGYGFFAPSQDLVDAHQVTGDGLPILDIEARPQVKHDNGIESKDEFIPTDQLLDLRLDYSVARRGIPFMDYAVFRGAAWIRDKSFAGPYFNKKFFHEKHNHPSAYGVGRSMRNFRFYRLSHVILWRAECAIEAGELALARDLVNQIRNRAKASKPVMGLVTSYQMPTAASVVVDYTKPAANYKVEPYPADHPAFASQAEARKAVRTEIQIEFATEGHRFFDLRRWDGIEPGYMATVLNNFIRRDTEFRGFMKDAMFVSPRNEFFPMPQAQLDLQPGVLVQDKYY